MSWTGPSTSGMDRSYVAPVSPHVHAVQTLAAQIHAACRRHFSKGSAAGRLASERRARMSWTGPSTSGMDRSYVAPVSPHVHAVQTLAAQIHAACRRHFSKGSAAGRLASERRARMSWTGPSTSGMDRSYVAPVSPHVHAVQTLAAQIHAVWHSI